MDDKKIFLLYNFYVIHTNSKKGSAYPSFLTGILLYDSMKNESWKNKQYSFFSHKECEYFPCHSAADPDNFNCLFCYCPLYFLGPHCGGSFSYLPNGHKDCSTCLYPHIKENYGEIVARYQEIAQAMPKPD